MCDDCYDSAIGEWVKAEAALAQIVAVVDEYERRTGVAGSSLRKIREIAKGVLDD